MTQNIIFQTCVGVSFATEEPCREPDSFGHIDAPQYTSIIRQHSYSLLPTEFVFADASTVIPDRFTNINYEYLTGHHRCPNDHHGNGRQGHNRHSYTVDNLNLCPVRYVRNVDSNRHPSLIVESECACAAPLNEPGLSCYPVTQYVKVFRRVGCEFSVYIYELVWEPVRVACVAGFKISDTSLNVRRKMPE